MRKSSFNRHILYIAAMLGCAGCHSDAQDYEGWIKYDRQACLNSGGTEVGTTFVSSNGQREKEICACNFGDKITHGSAVECYSSWVCDAYNYTCKECEDGKTICLQDKTSECIDGHWTVPTKCPKGCNESMTACEQAENETCAPKCSEDGVLTKCIRDEHDDSGDEAGATYPLNIACEFGCDSDKLQCKSCDVDYTCDGKQLKRCGRIVADCANGCDSAPSPHCTPESWNRDSCQKNDSRCVIRDGVAIQEQCFGDIWMTVVDNCDPNNANAEENCSVDAKTCKYCDNNYPPKCVDDNHILLCELGKVVTKVCPGGCQNNQCIDAEIKCSEDCKYGCDQDNSCKCSSACPNGCDTKTGECVPADCVNGGDNGICNYMPECPDECDPDGSCKCNEKCPNDCNPDGSCKCNEKCPDECNPDGSCKCNEKCPDECNPDGSCKCMPECPDECNPDGSCNKNCTEGDYMCQSEPTGATILKKCMDDAWTNCMDEEGKEKWGNCRGVQTNCSCTDTLPNADIKVVCGCENEERASASVDKYSCSGNNYLYKNGEPITTIDSLANEFCTRHGSQHYLCLYNLANQDEPTPEKVCACEPGKYYCYRGTTYFCRDDKKLNTDNQITCAQCGTNSDELMSYADYDSCNNTSRPQNVHGCPYNGYHKCSDDNFVICSETWQRTDESQQSNALGFVDNSGDISDPAQFEIQFQIECPRKDTSLEQVTCTSAKKGNLSLSFKEFSTIIRNGEYSSIVLKNCEKNNNPFPTVEGYYYLYNADENIGTGKSCYIIAENSTITISK